LECISSCASPKLLRYHGKNVKLWNFRNKFMSSTKIIYFGFIFLKKYSKSFISFYCSLAKNFVQT
jgi:hypothetical protein